jgi:hypothetical protein
VEGIVCEDCAADSNGDILMAEFPAAVSADAKAETQYPPTAQVELDRGHLHVRLQELFDNTPDAFGCSSASCISSSILSFR